MGGYVIVVATLFFFLVTEVWDCQHFSETPGDFVEEKGTLRRKGNFREERELCLTFGEKGRERESHSGARTAWREETEG